MIGMIQALLHHLTISHCFCQDDTTFRDRAIKSERHWQMRALSLYVGLVAIRRNHTGMFHPGEFHCLVAKLAPGFKPSLNCLLFNLSISLFTFCEEFALVFDKEIHILLQDIYY